MFIDRAVIQLKAGNGGDGAVSWRREKYVPSGGPDGGDGGKGGSIIIEADNGVQTLLDYKYKGSYKAEAGEPGRKKKQFGKDGQDLILKVPVGTVIREEKSNKPIADLTEHGQRFTAVKGGLGGSGNVRFKNSVRQAPRFAKPGGYGQELGVVLEVKLIADVGLVGLPNVGKSTILSILSNAKPKIANYHFTTLQPNLGVVKVGEGASFIIADVPGLIEGASDGLGLGHDFLRHIERTKVLAHVLDMSGSEGRDPLEDFALIQDELLSYNQELLDRVKIIVANKKDLSGYEENLLRFKEAYPDMEILEVSGATTAGTDELKYALWSYLKDQEKTYETLDEELVDVNEFFTIDPSINVYREGHTIFAKGEPLVALAKKLIIDDEDSITFFERTLEEMGVMDRVRDLHPDEDDTVNVEGFEFDWL